MFIQKGGARSSDFLHLCIVDSRLFGQLRIRYIDQGSTCKFPSEAGQEVSSRTSLQRCGGKPINVGRKIGVACQKKVGVACRQIAITCL